MIVTVVAGAGVAVAVAVAVAVDESAMTFAHDHGDERGREPIRPAC